MTDVIPETWKPAGGLEGHYEVSDLGRVRSLYRNSQRILRPSYSNKGRYPLYILTVNGVRYPRYGHQMVAEAFIGERPDGQEVRHLDGNASNAALRDADGVLRLAYGTKSENQWDQVRHGTHYQGSRTECENGHELTEDNIWTECHPDGTFKARRCKACNRDRSTKQRAKRKTDERRCREEGCDKPYFGSGMCSMHYGRQYRARKAAKADASDAA